MKRQYFAQVVNVHLKPNMELQCILRRACRHLQRNRFDDQIEGATDSIMVVLVYFRNKWRLSVFAHELFIYFHTSNKHFDRMLHLKRILS